MPDRRPSSTLAAHEALCAAAFKTVHRWMVLAEKTDDQGLVDDLRGLLLWLESVQVQMLKRNPRASGAGATARLFGPAVAAELVERDPR